MFYERIAIFVVLIFPIVCAVFLAKMFFGYLNDDKDICLDTAICKEGLTINIEGKLVEINKQTCVQNEGVWLEEKSVCVFK